MLTNIVGATPRVELLGTQDVSVPLQDRVKVAIPQHLPKFFLYAQKGPAEPQIVSGAEADNMYGSSTFDPNSKWYNHQTVFYTGVNSTGNQCVIQRMIPVDAGPKANITVYLDVLETTVDRYERNADGSILMTQTGDPRVIGTAPGFKVKFVTSNTSNVNQDTFGAKNITIGDQTDTAGNVSKRYPLFELKASSIGAFANSIGFRLWAPTLKSQSYISTKLMATTHAYPYRMAVVRKPDTISNPKIVETLLGSQNMQVTFKQSVIDPDSFARLYVGDVLLDAYRNLQDPLYPIVYGDLGDIHVYDNNIDTLVGLFHAKEKNYINGFSDFTEDPEQRHLFNFISGVSSVGVPYETFVFVDALNSVRFNESQNVYLGGGSDGTMSDDLHGDLVIAEMERYLDPDDIYQERVLNPERVIYDSGFPVKAKMKLPNFISVRRDTYVVMSTHSVTAPVLDAESEISLATAIRTRLRMYPESVYFGTETVRGLIYRQSGRLRNSLWTKRVPLSFEVAMASASYCGASDGKWKNGYYFNGAPNSVVKYLYDISNPWTPIGARNRNWNLGINHVLPFDKQSYFFAAHKTIYSIDGSVLNSIYVVMLICELNAILDEVWREFSGRDDLTPAQFEDRVNRRIIDKTNGRFDGKFTITPAATHTKEDLQRGYSITVPVKIGTDPMTTVLTGSIQAYRRKDLAN